MFLLILIFIFSSLVLGQERKPKTIDFLDHIQKYDVSDLWTLDRFNIENDTTIVHRPEPLGFIGENYQRFHIHFISAIRNDSNHREYFIYGKTKVKDNICTFQGIIAIEEARIFVNGDAPPLQQGYIKGPYEFYEDPDQKGTGILKGNFKTYFYIDEKGKLKYDALMFDADGFKNNQFEGTWRSYQTGNSKKCNWGDYRIPDSGNLDAGAGEFIPSEEYSEYGWADYRLAWGYSSDKSRAQEARNRENKKWWITIP